MLKTNCSFALLAPHGTGKSTLISSLLVSSKKPSVALNCMFIEKRSLFTVLSLELRKAIGAKEPFPQFNNLDSLAEHINRLYENRADDEFDRINREKGLVCVFENCEELKLKDKMLRALFHIGQRELPFEMSFVFVGVCFPSVELANSRPLCSLTTVLMPKPDLPFLTELSLEHLRLTCRDDYSKYMENAKKTYPDLKPASSLNFEDFNAVCLTFTKIVLEAIRYYTSDLNDVKGYMELMFRKLQEIIESQRNEPNVHRAIAGEYWKEALNKKVEYGPLNDGEIENIQIRTNDNFDSTNDYKFTFYPELLHTALFLAEKCGEADDLRRFKDLKKSKKGKLQEGKTRRHNMFRIQGIADSIESQGKKNDKELLLETHSLDYYSCYEHLVQ